jgi:hypothetical protein
VGPYRVCQRIGKLAYKVELLEGLTGVNPLFHMSQLRKCLQFPEQEVHTDALDIQDTLEYKEHPIQILDIAEKDTRSTVIPMCKVQWSNHTETESYMGEGVRTPDALPLPLQKVCLTLNLGMRFL